MINKMKLSLSNNRFLINNETSKNLSIEVGSVIDFNFENNCVFLIVDTQDGIILRNFTKDKKELSFKNKTLTNCLIDLFDIDADKNTYQLNISDQPNENNQYLITM